MTQSLRQAHQKSSANRVALMAASSCGCIYCLRISAPQVIVAWGHDGETATCPFCGIDAVIAQETQMPIDHAGLQAMKRVWF